MILKGAKVAADNVLFEVNETVSIAENGSVEVGATCTVSGSAGNVKKGDINRFPITLPGITAVQNITDFTGGYDAESDADLLERYLEKVSRPNVSGKLCILPLFMIDSIYRSSISVFFAMAVSISRS